MPSSQVPYGNNWDVVLTSLQGLAFRPEVLLEEVPAPTRLAPQSFALAADVVSAQDQDLANGRFVVLHDPIGQDTWDGDLRIVTFIKASVESDLVTDELFDEVAWTWLTETLDDFTAMHHNLSGTITRTISRSFADLRDRESECELELRASWTPDSYRIAEHLEAWVHVLERCAGLEPLPPGVTALPRNK